MAFMGPIDYRNYGWFYSIVGLGLFVAAVISLFDPGSTKIYIGALLVGPIMFARGIYFLAQYYRERGSTSPLPEGSLPGSAAELYASDIRQGFLPKQVTCEACDQPYVYFPARAAEAQAAKLGSEVAKFKAADAIMKGCAVAPCPRCGWIQQDMLSCARGQAPASISFAILMYAGILVTFFSVMFFCYVMIAVVTPAMRQPGEITNLSAYWLANAALLLLGVGLLIWTWMRHRSWDPNTQPAEARLRLAQQVSLSREVYVNLLHSREASRREVESEAPPE